VRFTDFEIADGSGRPLLSGADLSAAPGEAVHIHGDSSTGKSTLVRVLAGLWPAASGNLALPDRAQMMIAPQKSYLPLDSLKGALLYPDPSLQVSDADLRAALGKVGLDTLAGRLDERARWDQVLSNGERQRLGIARLLVHRPRVVILDDAVSALEESAQAALLARLRSELPEATIGSLAQRPAPGGVHDRQLALERRTDSAAELVHRSPMLATAK
jgi:putative ATP-binding cassette transporter